jgi:hypothetical protein
VLVPTVRLDATHGSGVCLEEGGDREGKGDGSDSVVDEGIGRRAVDGASGSVFGLGRSHVCENDRKERIECDVRCEERGQCKRTDSFDSSLSERDDRLRSLDLDLGESLPKVLETTL